MHNLHCCLSSICTDSIVHNEEIWSLSLLSSSSPSSQFRMHNHTNFIRLIKKLKNESMQVIEESWGTTELLTKKHMSNVNTLDRKILKVRRNIYADTNTHKRFNHMPRSTYRMHMLFTFTSTFGIISRPIKRRKLHSFS